MKKNLAFLSILFVLLAFGAGIYLFATQAKADTPGPFSLVITPSPLVATVNPGETSTLQIKILNNGTGTENLQIQPRSFTVNNTTGQIKISDSVPSDVGSWISFSAPKFKINVGQWLTEDVKLAVPQDAGFSYSFILEISRQAPGPQVLNGQALNGSVADFTLINVNRPGATQKLSVVDFTVSKHIFQWLPATFTIKFKNVGNTIVQPFGNIYIQRSSNSKTPINTLLVNNTGGFVLPGTERSFTNQWSNGFPVYESSTSSTGATTQHLNWVWSNLSDFRIGRYTADLVAVYNNGNVEVPIQGQVSFWVIPWVALIVFLVVGLLLLFGLWSLGRALFHLYQRIFKHSRKTKETKEPPVNNVPVD